MSEITNKINDLHTKIEAATKACSEAIGATRDLEFTIVDEGHGLLPASDLWLLRSRLEDALSSLRSEHLRPWNLLQDVVKGKA